MYLSDLVPMLEKLEPRRLFDAGQLDLTFDVDGRAAIPFGQLVGLQADGRIVVTKQEAGGFRLARLTSEGTIDSEFHGSEHFTSQLSAPSFEMNPLDGRIAFIGSGAVDGETHVGIFNADGTPDTSFDTDGEITLELGYTAQRLAWQGSKLVLLGGPYVVDAGFDPTLVRLNENGTLDDTFGTAGKATLAVQPDALTGLHVLQNGKIIVSMDDRGFSGETQKLSIMRLEPEGSPDGSFGAAGTLDVLTTSNDAVLATAAFNVEPDGVIQHLTRSQEGVRYRQFNSDGTLEVTSPLLSAPGDTLFNYYPRQLDLQPDGKPLLIGDAPTINSNNTGWNVTRLNLDGTFDATYGANGTALPDVQSNGRALVQPDGRVLVSGLPFGTSSGDGDVLRLDVGAPIEGTITLNRKGTLIVTGTAAGEKMGVWFRMRDSRVVAYVGNVSRPMAPSKVKRIALLAGAGNDIIWIEPGIRGAYLGGEEGFDTLEGGDGEDVLVGGHNDDHLFGSNGSDILVGEGGDDYCLGGAGNDIIYGSAGIDTLNGAGGNDKLFGDPNQNDFVNGGNGLDQASDDPKDIYQSVETLLDLSL